MFCSVICESYFCCSRFFSYFCCSRSIFYTKTRLFPFVPFRNDRTAYDISALSIPNACSSVEEVSRFIVDASSLFGSKDYTTKIRNLHANTKGYESRKQLVVARFFAIIGCHPDLAFLANLVVCPETNKKLQHFFIQVRGVKTPAKWNVINTCMLLFGQGFVKKEFEHRIAEFHTNKKLRAEAQYQPSTLCTAHKTLFSFFKNMSVIYQQSDFKSQAGSFQAYWSSVFKETCEIRSDYGTKPNAPFFDKKADEKIYVALENNVIKPFESLEDMQELLVHFTLKIWKLRGQKEVSISVDCRFFVVTMLLCPIV